jgi:hypothetical protein
LPPFPTRNTIGVKELWGGAHVGIDVWALRRNPARPGRNESEPVTHCSPIGHDMPIAISTMVRGILLVKSGGDAAVPEWQAGFQAVAPEFVVRSWTDPSVGPESVAYELVWEPEPGRIAGYPNLRVIFSSAAGVDHIVRDPTVPPHLPIVRMVSDVASRTSSVGPRANYRDGASGRLRVAQGACSIGCRRVGSTGVQRDGPAVIRSGSWLLIHRPKRLAMVGTRLHHRS